METFSALLAICAANSPVIGVNSPHKGQWRGGLMFSVICTWINGWVNNGEAGDLRRHRTVIEMTQPVYLGIFFDYLIPNYFTFSIWVHALHRPHNLSPNMHVSGHWTSELFVSRFANSNVYYFMILSTPSLAGDFYLNFFMGCIVEIPAYTVAILVIKYVLVFLYYISSTDYCIDWYMGAGCACLISN